MRSPEILVGDDIGEAFATYLTERAYDASCLFISGGTTGPQLFAQLINNAAVLTVFTSLVIAQVDERVVPTDNTDSNHYRFRVDFLDKLQPEIVAATDFRPMVGADIDAEISKSYEGRSIEREPERSDVLLMSQLRANGLKISDHYEELTRRYIQDAVVHLGIGPDGHIASLFPNSEALESTRYVDINFDRSGTNKHRRTTLTFESIMKARQVVVVASGERKAEIIRKVLSSNDLPASRLLTRDTTWLLDKEAARDISK